MKKQQQKSHDSIKITTFSKACESRIKWTFIFLVILIDEMGEKNVISKKLFLRENQNKYSISILAVLAPNLIYIFIGQVVNRFLYIIG